MNQKEISERFREFSERRGRQLEPIGSHGWALPFRDAIEALVILRGSGLAVLGGSVLEESDGALRFRVENWSCEPAGSEPFPDYSRRSVEQALSYLRSWPRATTSSLFVSLSTVDEPSLRDLPK